MNNGHRRLTLESIESRICLHGVSFVDNVVDQRFVDTTECDVAEVENLRIVSDEGQIVSTTLKLSPPSTGEADNVAQTNVADLEFEAGRTEHSGELGNDWIVGGTGQDAKSVQVVVRFAGPGPD